MDVFVSGDLAYVSAGDFNPGIDLQIIDVGNPYNPIPIGSYEGAGCSYVHVSSDLAYIASANGWLAVIDVSDPRHPVPRGSIDLRFWLWPDFRVYDVYASGPLVYLACGSTGLVILRYTGDTGALEGYVFDEETGKGLEGARVQVEATAATTDVEGEYCLGGLEPGPKTVWVSKTGYYSVERQVTLHKGATVVMNFGLRREEPTPRPILKSVTSPYSWPGRFVFFLDGVDLNVKFTADVEWNGTPGVMRFVTPRGMFEQPTASRTFNVGRDFGPGGSMHVIARNGEGEESVPYVVEFLVVSPPSGVPANSLTPVLSERDFRYEGTFDLQLLELGVGDNVVPASVPLVGGRAFKVVNLATVELAISSSGIGSLRAKADVPLPGDGIRLGGAQIGLNTGVCADWGYSREIEAWRADGYLALGASANVNLPPAPPYAVYLLMLGPVPVYLRGEIAAELAARLGIVGWDDQGPDLNGILLFSPSLKGFLGAGVAQALAVEGYLGGALQLKGQWPNTPALRECSLLFTGGVCGVILGFRMCADLLAYQWSLYHQDSAPRTAIGLPVVPEFDPSQFELLPRDYLLDAPHAQFVADKPLSATRGYELTQAAVEQAVQENVYPYSQPAVVTAANNTLLAWVQDDPGRSSINRTNLVFSICDGAVWTLPAPVADDGTADFAPSVAGLPDGTFLVAWNDARTTLQDTDTLPDLLAAMEISVSRYDPATGQWGAAVRLTDNDTLDHTPHLVSASDGTAMLAWTHNAGNDTFGSALQRNTIRYSRWDGSSWGPVGAAAGDIGPMLKTSLAYSGTAAALVFSIDLDGNLATENHQELFGVPWNGAAWEGLPRLTNNGVRDAGPQAVYDAAGDLIIAWLQGDRIVTAHGLALENPRVAVVAGRTEGAGDFRVVCDSVFPGLLALFWADASPQGQDIWMAMYDPLYDSWGRAVQLTSDDWMERSLAPTFRVTGEWLLAYNKVETLYGTRTVIVDGTPVEVPNVPEAGRTDLYVMRHTMGGDLAVWPSDIQISPPNPNPASDCTLSAVIWNLGERSVENVDVVFYDGDPGRSGTQIDSMQTIATPMAAGTSATATVNWTVPSSGIPDRIYVAVDPAGNQHDRDRRNNVAFIEAVKPDLKVQEFFAEAIGTNHQAITVRVANDGVIIASPTTVRIYLKKGRWILLHEGAVAQLGAGAHTDIGFVWDVGWNRGSFGIKAVVDEGNLVPESDEGNNDAVVRIHGLNPTRAGRWQIYR